MVMMSNDQVCDEQLNLSPALLDAATLAIQQIQDSFKCCNVVASCCCFFVCLISFLFKIQLLLHDVNDVQSQFFGFGSCCRFSKVCYICLIFCTILCLL